MFETYSYNNGYIMKKISNTFTFPWASSAKEVLLVPLLPNWPKLTKLATQQESLSAKLKSVILVQTFLDV